MKQKTKWQNTVSISVTIFHRSVATGTGLSTSTARKESKWMLKSMASEMGLFPFFL
jgi:hypothetical protein